MPGDTSEDAEVVGEDHWFRSELTGPPAEIAPRLLGAALTSDLGARVTLRITEVEAYAGRRTGPRIARPPAPD